MTSFLFPNPPVDDHYLFVTHVLEQAEHQGALVINRPQALRDANEKLFSAWFKAFTAPTLVSQNARLIKAFIDKHQTIVLKHNQMGGTGIVKLVAHDPNIASLIDILTHKVAAQLWLRNFFLKLLKETGSSS